MKRLAFAALTAILFIALPSFAQPGRETPESKAAEDAAESPTEGARMPVWAWLNFVLLAGGLAYIIRKNAGPYFARRSREIRKGMVEADEARAEADAKVAEVDRRLASLDAEIEALRSEARHEEQAENERAGRETAEEIAKIRAHLADEIAAAGKSAQLELRRYSAQKALDLAEQKILQGMSPEIQERLIRSFIANLRHGAYRVQSI